ncbi:MAG: hypothetical protein BMS9Abin30_0566 [Gammaproteobacteria bacterium]|nr:MAG: hypothetical protein BMS9Abin30_0566 [Gammaproteobacteria bacterium]
MNEEIEDAVTDPVDRLLQEKKPASSGKGIAVVALLVALVAGAASGWQWWQAYSTDTDGVSQQETLTRLQVEQERLARSVESFEAQLDAAESPVDPGKFSRFGEQLNTVERKMGSLQGQSGEDTASIAALLGSVRSIEQRLSTVESGLTSVAAKSQNSSVELEVAEIDFLLRAANERLQLFSDPAAADLALQAADIQIEALNDPLFLSVRQRIATSRRALATVPRVDRVQLSAKFTELQSSVPNLPFRGESTAASEPELPPDAGWWERLKQTLSSLVTVRRRVSEEESLLSLEDKDYLRQGLWLQLESARLALMRNDAGAYASSLDRVDSTLKQFFRNGSPAVQTVLNDVAAMKQLEIAPEMPDISAPWTQLRQLRDSRRLLQSALAVESRDSVE